MPEIKASDEELARRKAGQERDALKDESLKHVSRNLKEIRTKIFDENMLVFSRKIDAAVGVYHKWESGESLPGVDTVLLLKNRIGKEHSDYKDFTIDEFLRTDIVWDKSEEVSEIDFTKYIGTYLCYFHDLSETRKNRLETTKYRLRYITIYTYEKINLSGKNTLAVKAAPFKKFSDAVALKNELDSVAETINGTRPNNEDIRMKSDLVFNNIIDKYTGDITFLGNKHFEISMTNTLRDDSVSMLFIIPKTVKEDRYLGGIGLLSSICRGFDDKPVAQKIIMSDGELNVSDEKISELLSSDFTMPDIDGCISGALAFYEPENQQNHDSSSPFVLSTADRQAIVAARIKSELFKNIKELNYYGIKITSEDDSNVYHILRHYVKRTPYERK